MKAPASPTAASVQSDAQPQPQPQPQPPAFVCSHCSHCGYNNFPPSGVCPKCWSERTQPQDLSRDGVLYSFSTSRIGDVVRFVGYVDLPDQVRVFGQLSMQLLLHPACGMRVRLSCVQAPGSGPCFVFDVLESQEPE